MRDRWDEGDVALAGEAPHPIPPDGGTTFSRKREKGGLARFFAVTALLLTLAVPAHAVEPGEMLKDPALESRARAISEGLRCLVCQNESIDESHADLARDIRLLVRQRLLSGDSNQEVKDYLVARYGQFILLKPPLEAQTLLLWGTPLIVLVLGGAGVFYAARTRRAAPRDPSRPLSDAERVRLDELLSGEGG